MAPCVLQSIPEQNCRGGAQSFRVSTLCHIYIYIHIFCGWPHNGSSLLLSTDCSVLLWILVSFSFPRIGHDPYLLCGGHATGFTYGFRDGFPPSCFSLSPTVCCGTRGFWGSGMSTFHIHTPKKWMFSSCDLSHLSRFLVFALFFRVASSSHNR